MQSENKENFLDLSTSQIVGISSASILGISFILLLLYLLFSLYISSK